MGLDLTKLDSKIGKMQELRRIAEDPEMLEILESIVAENGTARRKNRRTPALTEKGDLKRAVIMTAARIRGKFTANELATTLDDSGYVFTAKNPKIAVDGVLRRLLDDKFIKVAVEGSGRIGTEYQKTPKFRTVAAASKFPS